MDLLENATSRASLQLQNASIQPDFINQLQFSFGIHWDTKFAENIVHTLATNIESLKIEILPEVNMNGAKGGFDSLTGTIYLAEGFMSANNIDAIATVILEEIGHQIDSLLNPQADSPGDEGEIFANLVQGKNLTESEILQLKQEDDRVNIQTKTGQEITVEANSNDFNNNGTSDILWRNPNNGQNRLWLMDGVTKTQKSLTSMSPKFEVQALGDVDNNGTADILWRNSATGQNRLWLMDGATKTQKSLTSMGSQWQVQEMGDFNNDGKADILWRNPANGQNRLWLMNGATKTQQTLDSMTPEFEVQALGDLDNNGTADIVWRNPATGQNLVWFMNGGTKTQQSLDSMAAEFDLEGTGDFNNDGKADILWRNPTTGQNHLWFMNGATKTQQTLDSMTSQFQFQQIGDFNNDAKADILWRNPANGQNLVWFMNGATKTQQTLDSMASQFEVQPQNRVPGWHRSNPNNLQLSSGTYLGTASTDTAVAVEISPTDSAFVIAGNFNGIGQIQRLKNANTAPLSTTNLGGVVKDLDVDRNSGEIVAVGDFGLKVYNKTAKSLTWSKTGIFDRVAVANDGTIATLSANQVKLWSPTGTELSSTTLTGTGVNPSDIAIHPTTKQVFVTGYEQVTSTLKTPFVRGFNRSLSLIWDTWDFSASEVTNANLGADSTGKRITFGQDNQLYFLGETDGGNNVFQRDGQDLTKSLAALVDVDSYNRFDGAGAGSFTFYAQLNPTNGNIQKGQFLVTRKSTGANSFSPNSITADELGNLYIGGSSAYQLQNRDVKTINGQTVGTYTLGEMAIATLSSDWKTRKFWTSLTQTGDTDGSKGEVKGFAVRNGRAVILGNVTQPGVVTTANALNPNPLGGQDAYLATWNS